MDSPDFWTTPTVHDYGKMHFLPNGAFKPQPGHTYKVVFALAQGGKKPDEVSPALDHVARAVNLYVASGFRTTVQPASSAGATFPVIW
jgi:hypothetical protein